jgi:hypothetical protein
MRTVLTATVLTLLAALVPAGAASASSDGGGTDVCALCWYTPGR